MVISDLLDNIRLLFVSEKKPFLQLMAILGFLPHNIKLYDLALKHKSVTYYEQEHMKEARKREGSAKTCHIQSTVFANNERLEFLGDAVLGAIVADILYKHYGNKQEGFLLTDRRMGLPAILSTAITVIFSGAKVRKKVRLTNIPQ